MALATHQFVCDAGCVLCELRQGGWVHVEQHGTHIWQQRDQLLSKAAAAAAMVLHAAFMMGSTQPRNAVW
jgi:hypothetical protein